MRNRHSGSPFAEPPADIAAALTDLSVPALLTITAHRAPCPEPRICRSGGSIIFAAECAVRLIMGCLRMLTTSEGRRIEVRADAFDAYTAKAREEMPRKVWASPHIAHNYYRNDAGEVTGLNPFRLVDYWRGTSAPDPGEYEIG